MMNLTWINNNGNYQARAAEGKYFLEIWRGNTGWHAYVNHQKVRGEGADGAFETPEWAQAAAELRIRINAKE